MLISISQLKASARRYSALASTPERAAESDFRAEALIKNVPEHITKGNIIGSDQNLVKRKQMLKQEAKEPVDFAYERVIGKNDSVYSNFVELIEAAKKKVGRIDIKQGIKTIGYATGFMVSQNLMLTNWHVFQTIDDVADSELQFFYEYDTNGRPEIPISFRLDTKKFYYSNKDLDYCFVAVEPIDITGKRKLSDFGYIYLDPGLGKLGDENVELLNIIHHPEGDYKQLSIRENKFVKITPQTIWYETDTAPGSSGSPVFNDQWQIVALHHMGVAKMNSKGDYIDKDGKVISIVDGKVDSSRIVWIANEGIRISVILNDFLPAFKGKEIAGGLKLPPPEDKMSDEILSNDSSKNFPSKNNNNNIMEQNNSSNNVEVSIPAELFEKTGSINININQSSQVITQSRISVSSDSATTDTAEADEVKKLESTTDYSACNGYQADFLGKKFKIAVPQPLKQNSNTVAKPEGSKSNVLDYFNYSVIFHSEKKMPIISAVNVDGDPARRNDKSKRKDTWLRDTRLSFDIQLDDAFYKNSGFDKGHMSRREDADWGTSASEAKRNADLTCMYTNACPQVPKINQSSRKGLWGILEKVVLENGAEQEKGVTGKISVFNGPIFKDDDPKFRDVKIPMDFFKIVLWLTDKGNLKATAFRLTQKNLVKDINFEELDLDKNTEIKEYQCSIKSLQKDTGIDFGSIVKFDTFDQKKVDAVELVNESDVRNHIIRNRKK